MSNGEKPALATNPERDACSACGHVRRVHHPYDGCFASTDDGEGCVCSFFRPRKTVTVGPSTEPATPSPTDACALCGVTTSHWAGNPLVWPIGLHVPGDEAGTSRPHCLRCVHERVYRRGDLADTLNQDMANPSPLAKSCDRLYGQCRCGQFHEDSRPAPATSDALPSPTMMREWLRRYAEDAVSIAHVDAETLWAAENIFARLAVTQSESEGRKP